MKIRTALGPIDRKNAMPPVETIANGFDHEIGGLQRVKT
jgi:hypothetical protein